MPITKSQSKVIRHFLLSPVAASDYHQKSCPCVCVSVCFFSFFYKSTVNSRLILQTSCEWLSLQCMRPQATIFNLHPNSRFISGDCQIITSQVVQKLKILPAWRLTWTTLLCIFPVRSFPLQQRLLVQPPRNSLPPPAQINPTSLVRSNRRQKNKVRASKFLTPLKSYGRAIYLFIWLFNLNV